MRTGIQKAAIAAWLGMSAALASVAPTAAATNYITIPGSAFVRSTTAMAVSAAGPGCITSEPSGLFHAAVNLPDGSTVVSIAFAYSNATPLASATLAFLYSFHDLTPVTNASVASLTASGANASSAAANVAIDNGANTYMLGWVPGASGGLQSLCHVRLGYQ